jgi:hypothetical protein
MAEQAQPLASVSSGGRTQTLIAMYLPMFALLSVVK